MDSTINGLQNVMEVLRRQIAESAQRLDAPGKSPTPSAATPNTAKASLPDLKRRIKERLDTITKDDPARAKKAYRLFIESVLVWEFGDALLLDPRFEEMLTRLQEGLGSVPNAQQQFDKLLASIERD